MINHIYIILIYYDILCMILRTYVNFYVSATRRAHLSSSEGFLDISLPGSRSTNGDAMGSRAFQ